MLAYNGSQLNEVADYTSKLNLKNEFMNTDKTSLENENQPSCLGAVSGSTLVDKEFENLWNGKELKPRYYDGDKNWDNDNNVKIAFEILWGK